MTTGSRASVKHGRTIAVIASIWLGMLFWVGVFWAGGLLATSLDVRVSVLAFAPPWLQFIGLLLAIIGLLLVFFSGYLLVVYGGGSPNPLLAPAQVLVTHGLYAYLRHPMYTGFIALAFGYGLLLDSLTFTVIFAPLVLGGLSVRAFLEERSLLQRHGANYEQYRRVTAGFFPRLQGGR